MAISAEQSGGSFPENDSGRPDRAGLTHQVADLMGGGAVLMAADLVPLLTEHGFSERNAASYSQKMLEVYSFGHNLHAEGVELEKVIYRGKKLYYNGMLDLETETNIDEVRARVDVVVDAHLAIAGRKLRLRGKGSSRAALPKKS